MSLSDCTIEFTVYAYTRIAKTKGHKSSLLTPGIGDTRIKLIWLCFSLLSWSYFAKLQPMQDGSIQQ